MSPRRESPQPSPGRWSPETTVLAQATLAWISEQAALGHTPGEDEVWAYVTTTWPAVTTGTAENVLNAAMGWHDAALAAPSEGALRVAILGALRGVCDGTYSDDPASWTLALGVEGGPSVPDFAEEMARAVRAALLGQEAPEAAPARGPGRG